MQATSLTGACATVVIVLGVIGLYLDSLAAVAGALGLVGLLGGQGVLFLYRTARFTDELEVERVVEGRQVYLGAPIGIAVRVTATASPGLQVRLSDLPPASAVYDSDEAVLRNGEGRYRVRFMTPGEVSFRGLLVEAGSRFFTTTVVLAAHGDTARPVFVMPVDTGTADTAPGTTSGSREVARAGMPQGDGIRGFRPFHLGDDRAKIDWKLTAKHDRPFVREPTSEAGSTPIVVVDLPGPESTGAGAVLSAAGSEIRRVVREQGRCTLLVIAGGEVIASRHHERDLAALLRLLSLRPPGPIRPLYRVKDPAVLLERLRSAEREMNIPAQRFAAALRTALVSGVRSEFEREVDRAMAATDRGEVVVYTDAPADVSHLNLVAAAARRRRRRLVIRSPTARSAFAWLSPYPRVEAL